MASSGSSSTDHENIENKSSDFCLSSLAGEDSDENPQYFRSSYCSSPYSCHSSRSTASEEEYFEPYIPEWGIELPKRKRKMKDDEISQYTVFSDETQSDIEEVAEVSPQTYDDIPENQEQVARDPYLMKLFDELRVDFRYYWLYMKRLQQKRLEMIKMLQHQLEKPERYEEGICHRINAKINAREKLLNMYIPVLPKVNALCQAENEKQIIQENEGCNAYINVDDSGRITEGSFPVHFHRGIDQVSVRDDLFPSTPATVVSLPRVDVEGKKPGNYYKTLKLLNEIYADMEKWIDQAELCKFNAEKIQKLIAEIKERCPTTDLTVLQKYFECVRLETK
uniref:Uncharacterized protein n=1 Tax=Panagrolaimus sp. ES5 TaxID=591445 RepID=A0AC34FQ28_9BILA